MKDVITNILTNADARNETTVEQMLVREADVALVWD